MIESDATTRLETTVWCMNARYENSSFGASSSLSALSHVYSPEVQVHIISVHLRKQLFIFYLPVQQLVHFISQEAQTSRTQMSWKRSCRMFLRWKVCCCVADPEFLNVREFLKEPTGRNLQTFPAQLHFNQKEQDLTSVCDGLPVTCEFKVSGNWFLISAKYWSGL